MSHKPTAPQKKKKKTKAKPRVSRTHRPPGLSLEAWQIELRRQFGREQKFKVVNKGAHPVFSDFAVTNPESRNTYRVRVRGRGVGDNACTCPDFATNALGTCKHIEFTLAKLGRNSAHRRALKAGFQPPHAEIFLQYGSRRDVRFRPGAETPPELARLAATVFDEMGTMRPEALGAFEDFLRRAGEMEPGLTCDDDVLAFLAERRDAVERARRVAEAFPRGVKSAAFKDMLGVPLYDYQREGALFAARAGRCLIGDEMGLGKTIQAIAAAEIMARLHGVERVLVICPTSLKHQWEREITRFIERPVGVIGGGVPERRAGFRKPGDFFKVTNYDTVHVDLDEILAWSPDLVILDEAQRIKNWKTRAARTVKKVASPYAIVLTGTPLENRLEELVSIVQFIDLFRLGPTFRLLHDHQVTDEYGKVVGYRDLDKLGQSLAPILIRRTKAQVLTQLPGRIDTNVFVPMTDEQMGIHNSAKEVVARIVLKWKRYKFLSEADQLKLMKALQTMRMSCDDAYLVDEELKAGRKRAEVVTLLNEMLERPGMKVVLFSQWLKMHELISADLTAAGVGHVFFHGGVPGPQRKHLIDRFRDDPECKVFLATDAGSVGLNLQNAGAVVNVDLPWNPAVLEQRIGRVHRMGVAGTVSVVNFVARGTIEEGMLGLLKFKSSLAKGILDGGEKEISLGGSRLTKFMETVEKATGSIPAAPPREDTPAPEEPAPVAQTPPAEEPWAEFMRAGVALLGRMSPGAPGSLVRRDEATGEEYLRLPVPPAGFMEQALGMVRTLLEGFGKR